MFYSAKNCKVRINDNILIVNSARLSSQNSVSPVYAEKQRLTKDYAPTDGVNGSLELSYYLTGKDFLKDYLTSDSVFAFNFAGITVQSGCLRNHSISITPNSPLEINASVDFYENPAGQITLEPAESTTENFLNGSDVTFYFQNTLASGKIREFSQSFSCRVEPVYITDAENCQRIIFGERNIQTSISLDNTLPDISYTGLVTAITGNIKDKNGTFIDSISASGVITSKEWGLEPNQVMSTSLTILQNTNENAPSIDGFSIINANGETSDWIYEVPISVSKPIAEIVGSNLKNTTSVYFSDREAEAFTIIGDNKVLATAPTDLITGFIKIESYAGSATAPLQYFVNYQPLTINSLSKYTFASGETVQINGDNFYRVSGVKFGEITGEFNVINKNIISAIAPDSPSGYISVITYRNKETVTFSETPFYEYPIILDITPKTGWEGGTTIVTGKNFCDINTVKINEISCSFTPSLTDGLVVTIPTGNTYGYVSISGKAEREVISNKKFFPTVNITGLIPTGALTTLLPAGSQENTMIILTGQNIKPALLTSQQAGMVDFCGIPTMFSYVDGYENMLSGYVPSGVPQSGYVRLYRPDMATMYDSGQIFYRYSSAPQITKTTPSYFYSGYLMNMVIYGKELINPTKITMTGHSGIFVDTPSNYGFNVPLTSGKQDSYGMKYNINYTLHDIGKTGKYLAIFETAAGTGYADSLYAFMIYSGVA